MLERLFKKKAKIEERRREMVLEVYERRFGQELLNMRLEKFLASEKEKDDGALKPKSRALVPMQVRPDAA